MKPSDTLPTPLDHKPDTKLTELGRTPGGEGWETVIYKGEDGHRYEATVKGNLETRWRLIPPEEIDGK